PIPPPPVPAQAGQQVAPEALAAHAAWVKGSKKIAGIMLMTMEPEIQMDLENLMQNFSMHGMGKTVNELHAMLHEQTQPKENAPALHVIRAGKVQKKKNKQKPRFRAKGQNQRKGKNKHAYDPNPKIPLSPKRKNPSKDSICHQCGDTGHWKRNCPQNLAELLKNMKLSQGASSSVVLNKVSKFGAFHHMIKEACKEDGDDVLGSSMEVKVLPKKVYGGYGVSIIMDMAYPLSWIWRIHVCSFWLVLFQS
ncbi:retrotransposon protein, putative, ty1-copia subclass, partial [Tanacetum coccineum]